MPTGLRRVLERAIHARQRCAEWFQTSMVENKYSNEGHQHFIEVLEQTLDILETHKAPRGNKAQAHSMDKKEQNMNTLLQEITNRFQPLEVEESVDSDDFECIIAGTDVWELEEESEETRMSLMIFCFLKDLHRIKEFLHSTWKRYKEGTLDLSTASVVTNASFHIVRRNEEEITAAAPHLFSMKRSYATIAVIIFYAHAFSQGQNPEEMLTPTSYLSQHPSMISSSFPPLESS
jgi:hypothetical protein